MSKNFQDILMDMNFHQIKNLGAPTDQDDAVRLRDLIAAGSGSFAPTSAKYIIQQPVVALPNAQAISDLPSGILYGTTATGVISIAIAGTNFVPPSTQIIAGAGLIGGGPLTTNVTIDAVAHPDGSIIVNPNNIQVGVINDAQHGARGGGSLHPLATNITAGFMGPTDKAIINNARFFVGSATNAPPGSQNTATLGPGVLKQTVTGGVATIAIATAADLLGNLIFSFGLTKTGNTVTNDVVTGKPIALATWTGSTIVGGGLDLISSNDGSVSSKGPIRLQSSQLLLTTITNIGDPTSLLKPDLAGFLHPDKGMTITSSGLYFITGGNFWFNISNARVGAYNGSYFTISLGGIGDPAPRMYAEGGSHFAIKNLANPLGIRVYNNVDSGSVNYERGIFTWLHTANNLVIGTEAGGSGVLQPVRFVGQLFNFTNSVYIQTLTGILKGVAGLVTVAIPGVDYLPGSTTLVAGTNITLVGTLASGSVTINSTGGGGGSPPLTFVDGLTRIVDTVHGDYITGKAGNQTWTGSLTDGNLPGGTLTIRATGHINKGVMTLDARRLFVSDSADAVAAQVNPPFAFVNNISIGISTDNTGMYFCAGGLFRMQVSDHHVGLYNNAFFSLSRSAGGGDVKMWAEATNYLGLRDEAQPKGLRIYKMFNSGTSAYERGTLDWTTNPGFFTITTEAGGTGVLGGMTLSAAVIQVFAPLCINTNSNDAGEYFTSYTRASADKIGFRVAGKAVADSDNNDQNYFKISGLNTVIGQNITAAASHLFRIDPIAYQGPVAGATSSYDVASTLYIGGSPASTGLVNLGKTYALFVNDGISRFDGGFHNVSLQNVTFELPAENIEIAFAPIPQRKIFVRDNLGNTWAMMLYNPLPPY